MKTRNDEVRPHAVKKYLLLCFTGLFKLQDLVKTPPSVRTEMYIRQAGPRSYRQVLREVRHKEIFKLIIDTDPAHMQQFFRAVSPKRFDIRHYFTRSEHLKSIWKFYLSQVIKKFYHISPSFAFHTYRSCFFAITLKILLYTSRSRGGIKYIYLLFFHTT